MKDEASIVEQYADSDVGERIAILIRYYPNFIRLVEGFERNLSFIIKQEKEMKRRAAIGELGVRVQNSHINDPTAREREPWVLKEWNYEKNGDLLPTRILHNSIRPVWWKDRKGHQWRAKISDRLLRAGCPICERERMNALPLEMIRYYSAKAGLDCRIADEGPIGIPLQVYYPDISSALEISPLFQRPSRKWENAKNWLCINAGIRLVRILTSKDDEYRNCICITREDDSEETLGLAISEAFRQLGVSVIIDMKDWLFYHNDAVIE